MKYTFFLLLFFVPFSLLSQSDKKKVSLFDNIPSVIINLKNERQDEKIGLPYRNIKVLDYRNDTSIAGITHFETFTGNGSFNTKYYMFKNGTIEETESYIKSISELSKNALHELVMIVRRIWIGSEFENTAKYDKDARMQKPFLGGVKTTFEFYALREGIFIPVKRFDTTITDNKMKQDEAETYLQKCINASISSVAMIDLNERILKGKKINFEAIDSFSKSLRSLKIFTDTQLTKGVYLSYAEFKNNNPRIKDFEIKETAQAHTLYVKDETGVELPMRKIWGFCDGERIYIQGANAYFELEYFNNTFYSFGAKKIDMVYVIPKPFRGLGFNSSSGIAGAVSQSLRQSSKYKLGLKLMQLDLETGILY